MARVIGVSEFIWSERSEGAVPLFVSSTFIFLFQSLSHLSLYSMSLPLSHLRLFLMSLSFSHLPLFLLSLSLSHLPLFLMSLSLSLLFSSFLYLFGQRLQRGLSPVEHRGTFF